MRLLYQTYIYLSIQEIIVFLIDPLTANPTKWSNTLKAIRWLLQKNCRVCLTILWGLLLKGYDKI